MQEVRTKYTKSLAFESFFGTTGVGGDSQPEIFEQFISVETEKEACVPSGGG